MREMNASCQPGSPEVSGGCDGSTEKKKERTRQGDGAAANDAHHEACQQHWLLPIPQWWIHVV